MRSGMCPPLGDCDFEHGLCSWSQDTLADDFDWVISSRDTSTMNVGPMVDHTRNSTSGM